MRYGQIRKYDIANGEGIRSTVFVTGCTHGCYNCFNEEYQDFNAGEVWTEKETELLIEYLQDPRVSGLTLLGGEPFQNVEGLLPVVKKIRQCSDKSIWVYSGYTLEEILLCERRKELLSYCDVLIDGRFMDELKDPSLKFRGSKNQRILNGQESLRTGKAVFFYDDDRINK